MCAGNDGMHGSTEGDWVQKRFYQNETKGTNLRHEIKGNLFEPNEYWYVVYFRNVRARVVQNTRANIRKRCTVHFVIAASMNMIDYKSIALEKIEFDHWQYGREKNATHRMNAHMDCVNFMSTREFCGREKLPKSIM